MQDTDAGLVVVVVEDLAEVVYTGICMIVYRTMVSMTLSTRINMRVKRLSGNITFHRLLCQVVILHLLYAL